jgi:2Fe-2S ferredoxin
MGKVTFLPSGKSIKARPGQTIAGAAASARVVISQRCHGRASCLMCRIVLVEGELTAPTSGELQKLSSHDLASGVRLACQAKTTQHDCTLRIPESRLKSVVQAALERERRKKEE